MTKFMRYACVPTIVLTLLAVQSGVVHAATSAAIKAAARHALKRGGSESVEQLTRQAAKVSQKYGRNGLTAFRKVGSRSLRLADEAGQHGDDVIRLLGKYGDDGVFLVANPKRLALATKYGDDAARGLLKHGDIVTPLIRQYGQHGAKAVSRLSSRNARRFAIMGKQQLKPELAEVISRHGNKACEFIWKNKVVLLGGAASATVLAAFLNNPEPFIDGTVSLATVGASNALKPMVTSVHWTPMLLIVLAFAGVFVWWRYPRKRQPVPSASH